VVTFVVYILFIVGTETLSHPDNILEVNTLITPLHIVPEWYFLTFYMVLKAIPNKTSGLFIFILTILVLLILVELIFVACSYNMASAMSYLNTVDGLTIIVSFYMLNTMVNLFIGAQICCLEFVSCGRAIVTFNNLVIFYL
jgi:ubiquinol-cytochrome c reductase cytochrome b subunit